MSSILAVPRSFLFPNGNIEGFIADRETITHFLQVVAEHGKYIDRDSAETNPHWKQIIPQILLVAEGRIFIHRIPKTGSEERLHDMWPIFLGGHVDHGVDNDLFAATLREFKEEIKYEGKVERQTLIGLVNLETPEVNAVHIGVVFIFFGDEARFKPTKDKGLIDGAFVTLEEAEAKLPMMNYWSQTAFPFIKEYLQG